MLSVSFCVNAQEVRSIDGFLNNLNNPQWGSTHTQLQRITTIDYLDGISQPAGQDRLNPREISNILFDQNFRLDDKLALSDFVWVFGQFIDHDITLVENFDPATNPEEAYMIFPPVGDPYFSPGDVIPMMRSKASDGTGTSIDNPRQHDNAITAFIDASAVYGADQERANWLRTFENGKLKTSRGENLPWNTISGEFNSPIDPSVPFMEDGGELTKKFYVAGDIRANENPLLIVMHTLFVREHNLLCDEVSEENPSWNDEQVYQFARKIVSGKIQSIVYNEWLPTMNIQIPGYSGYNPVINPGISNVFSAAAFRMGHTLINSNLIRMKNDGEIVANGNMTLRDAFFNPVSIELTGGVDPFIKGMGTQIQQDFDCKVISDVRNFLFGQPGQGGLDLAAININRGRERGLPDYNTIRADFGLPKLSDFSDLCSDNEVSILLNEIYGSVDNVDPWVGMLAENHLPGSLFGELVMKILENQFRALRDGDRFFYENDNDIPEEWKEVIRNTTLNNIIMRNTSINLMQGNVFRAMDHDDIPTGPEIELVELSAEIYPNPVNDHFYLKLFSEKEQELNLKIYNSVGTIIQESKLEMVEGINNALVNVSEELETGVYNLYLENDQNQYTVKRFFKL